MTKSPSPNLHFKLNITTRTSPTVDFRSFTLICFEQQWQRLFLLTVKGETRIWPNSPSLINGSSETWTEGPCLVFVVNLSLCRTPHWGSSVFQAGDTDFVATACAETDRPVCFICKAASQKARARRVLCRTPLLKPNCDGVPLSKLLCILGAQGMGRT